MAVDPPGISSSPSITRARIAGEETHAKLQVETSRLTVVSCILKASKVFLGRRLKLLLYLGWGLIFAVKFARTSQQGQTIYKFRKHGFKQ